jgi:hypothetical protein
MTNGVIVWALGFSRASLTLVHGTRAPDFSGRDSPAQKGRVVRAMEIAVSFLLARNSAPLSLRNYSGENRVGAGVIARD